MDCPLHHECSWPCPIQARVNEQARDVALHTAEERRRRRKGAAAKTHKAPPHTRPANLRVRRTA